jgi:hypothetical protein
MHMYLLKTFSVVAAAVANCRHVNDQNKPDREAKNPSELRLASIAAWTAIHKKTPVAAIATNNLAKELYAGYEVLLAGCKSGVVPDVVLQVCAAHTRLVT